MRRILLCLPLCLCLGSDRPIVTQLVPAVLIRADAVKDTGQELPSLAEMERLARQEPIAFLESCLLRYAREVKGYSLILKKQERINGKNHPPETIEVHFKEKPHSVYFHWLEGARLAEKALYVEGENDGKMLARPRGAAARLLAGDIVAREVDGPDARQSGRYPLNEFGLKKSCERTLAAWKAARETGSLDVEYVGVQKVKELGDRTCWILRRTTNKPTKEGVKETTIYVDTETWLQVGVLLQDQEGLLIGSYYFRDIKLNPQFKKDQFQRAALRP